MRPLVKTGVHAPGQAAQSLPAAEAKSAWALLPGSPGATPEADQERSCGGLDGREGVAAVRSKDGGEACAEARATLPFAPLSLWAKVK